MDAVLEGPAWAPHGLDVRPGRFPLSVEAHLMNMTARLVPGATTVTINARYYGLHGLIALEAERRGLALDAAAELLRRCEVIVGGASAVHPDEIAGNAHGHDTIKLSLEEKGTLDVKSLATPVTGYVTSRWGYLSPYVGSELTLRILADNDLSPRQRATEEPLRQGFEGIFDLADKDTVSIDALEGCPHLANGAGRTQPDGRWLARLLCSVGLEEQTKVDATRRGTVRLLSRAAVLVPTNNVPQAFRSVLAYGPALRMDPIIRKIAEAEPWRGTLVRHDSVGAWRALWAWLVGQISGHTAPRELVDALAGSLPTGTLGGFLESLPPTIDAAGDPAPAEEQVRREAMGPAAESLALLALGARRTGELDGRARDALVGDERRPVVLSPLWMRTWLDDRRDLAMGDVARGLVLLLIDRSKRIAMKKMRISKDGSVWLPTRVHERGEMLYKIGDERSDNVGLRVQQLTGILAAVGVLERVNGVWRVSDVGEELLRVRAS